MLRETELMKICTSLKTQANVGFVLAPPAVYSEPLASSQPIKLLWSRFLGQVLFHFLPCHVFCISPLSHLSSRCSNLFTSGSDCPSHMVMFTSLDLLLLKFFSVSYIRYIGGVWSSADICSSTQTLMVSLIEPLFCDRYFAKHLTHNNVPLRSPYTNSLRRVSLHAHLKWEHGGPPRLGNLSKDTLSERGCSLAVVLSPWAKAGCEPSSVCPLVWNISLRSIPQELNGTLRSVLVCILLFIHLLPSLCLSIGASQLHKQQSRSSSFPEQQMASHKGGWPQD